VIEGGAGGLVEATATAVRALVAVVDTAHFAGLSLPAHSAIGILRVRVGGVAEKARAGGNGGMRAPDVQLFEPVVDVMRGGKRAVATLFRLSRELVALKRVLLGM
jgi:hypothetical protein